MQLAMTNVDGNDMVRASFQQDLREPAGRCSDIECCASFHVDGKMMEAGDKFQRCARDIATGGIIGKDCCVDGNRGARLGDDKTVDLHRAAYDGVARP